MHLYLIGYRGSGKSTVGRKLAEKLSRPFIDSDEWIETRCGQSIREIFKKYGESGFRDREEEVVKEIAADKQPSIVALGGGAVLRTSNRNRIADSGRTVLLEASAELLHKRITEDAASGERRPNLTDRAGIDEVIAVLRQRQSLYRQTAQKIVSSEGKSPDQMVLEILDWANF